MAGPCELGHRSQLDLAILTPSRSALSARLKELGHRQKLDPAIPTPSLSLLGSRSSAAHASRMAMGAACMHPHAHLTLTPNQTKPRPVFWVWVQRGVFFEGLICSAPKPLSLSLSVDSRSLVHAVVLLVNDAAALATAPAAAHAAHPPP